MPRPPTRRCSRLEVDQSGLDAMDRRYLACIAENYGGGPVGVETLAAALSEQRDAIEDVIEPYLIQQGFVQRTPRGRMLTAGGFAPPRPARAAGAAATSSSCWTAATDDEAMNERWPHADGRIVFPVRVYYEDTDAGGIVYLRATTCASPSAARTELLRDAGLRPQRRCAGATGAGLRGAPLRDRLSAAGAARRRAGGRDPHRRRLGGASTRMRAGRARDGDDDWCAWPCASPAWARDGRPHRMPPASCARLLRRSDIE